MSFLFSCFILVFNVFIAPEEKTVCIAHSGKKTVGHSLVYPLCVLIKRSSAKWLFHNITKQILQELYYASLTDLQGKILPQKQFVTKLLQLKVVLKISRTKELTRSSAFSSSYDIFLQSCEGTWNLE